MKKMRHNLEAYSRHVTLGHAVAFCMLAFLLVGVYLVATGSERLVPAVRYTMGGREYTWRGKAQVSEFACMTEAIEKRRQILTGTGTAVLGTGCVVMNGNSVVRLAGGTL